MTTNADEMALRVLLGFLRAGRVLDHASSVLLLAALLAAPAAPLAAVLAAVALGALEKYVAWRVALDAEFFQLLLQQPGQEAAFDAALADFLGRKASPPPRTLASRWRGARRLVWGQALVLGAQAVAALLVLLLGRGW